MDIKVDFNQPSSPFHPYWRTYVSGGRMAEALRADFEKHFVPNGVTIEKKEMFS